MRGEHPVDTDGEAGLRTLHLALGLVRSATESRVLGKDDLRALWKGSIPIADHPAGDDL